MARFRCLLLWTVGLFLFGQVAAAFASVAPVIAGCCGSECQCQPDPGCSCFDAPDQPSDAAKAVPAPPSPSALLLAPRQPATTTVAESSAKPVAMQGAGPPGWHARPEPPRRGPPVA